MNILKKLYSPHHIIPEPERLGELPPGRAACRDVFNLALPTIFECVMVTLCGMVDTMMVGVIGTAAISAIGISNAPRILMTSIFGSLSIANSSVIARRIGEGSRDRASQTMKQSILYALVLLVIVCSIGFIFTPHMLKLGGAPESLLPDALAYMRIWLFGLPIWALGTPISSSFRAAGKPKIPVFANIVANLVNVLFNHLLIEGKLGFPALGVRGAAIATLLCYAVQTTILYCAALKKDSVLHLDLKSKFKFDPEIFSSIKVVFPAQTFSGFVVFAQNTTQTYIINSIGRDDTFAAWQIFVTLYSVLISIAEGFSVASATLVGQSLGRRRPDISIVYTRLCITLSLFFSLLFGALFGVFDEFIIGLYVPDRIAGKATFDAALTMLHLLILTIPINVLLQVFWGTLQGSGDAKFITFLTFFSFTCRTCLFYLFCLKLGIGVVGTVLAVIADDSARTLMLFLRYKRGNWKYIRL